VEVYNTKNLVESTSKLVLSHKKTFGSTQLSSYVRVLLGKF
jgi:hypothetical protein